MIHDASAELARTLTNYGLEAHTGVDPVRVYLAQRIDDGTTLTIDVVNDGGFVIRRWSDDWAGPVEQLGPEVHATDIFELADLLQVEYTQDRSAVAG